MIKRQTMGIDIDGTLSEFDSFLPYFNQLLGTKVKPEQIIQYDLHEVFGVEYDRFSDLFDEHSIPLYKACLPRRCAQEQLKWIDDRFEIVYITARYKEFKELTEEWLHQHGFPTRHIICTGSHDKVQAMQENKVHCMVEDRLENALQIWEQIKVPVYLLDTPYNQSKLPNGVSRVKDWVEIKEDLIRKGF